MFVYVNRHVDSLIKLLPSRRKKKKKQFDWLGSGKGKMLCERIDL